ncbi:hypothetical protein MN116_008946, partial [Schistosoma mekongi]
MNSVVINVEYATEQQSSSTKGNAAEKNQAMNRSSKSSTYKRQVESLQEFVKNSPGLTSELDYIKNVVGAWYIILGPITKGFYGNSHNILALVDDYEQLDEVVGTLMDFRLLLQQSHKKVVKVVITFDFNSISTDWIAEPNVKLMKFLNDSNNMNVIDYWMKEGIDGILLENNAFFVEDRTTLLK